MAVCAEDTQTPVIYAAISDPEAAEVTGIDYVTGTSDALNTDFIIDMMLKQNPDTKKVGLLYSLSEPNSATPVAEAREYLDSKGAVSYTHLDVYKRQIWRSRLFPWRGRTYMRS